jgi:HK97 family phage major capsid protein/HK97 family phage prohead protease
MKRKSPEKVEKAYSQFEIKAVDDEQRIIRGIATTPTADRVGDIVLPQGAQYSLPIPFLWQHDHMQPIGNVIEAKVTSKGIEVVIELVKLASPSQLAARLEEAWQSIKSGLVRGLSIGFSPKKYAFLDDGGIEFIEWSFNELSAVTVPCNAEATITRIKSLSEEQAALGKKAKSVVFINKSVGASTTKTTVNTPSEGSDMKIREQIEGFKKTLDANRARLKELAEAAGAEGRSFDAKEIEEFDTLTQDIDSAEEQIKRLEKVEGMNLEKAVPVPATPGTQVATASRSAAPAVVHTTKNEELGMSFAQFALSMFVAKGNIGHAQQLVETNFKENVRLKGIMKAAVQAATTLDPVWAGNLVDYRNMSSEFIEFLRPRTIIGQFGTNGIPNLRRIPFNVRIPGKTSAGSASWVGEGARKPVTESGYSAVELKWAKLAAISVVTDELARFSDPSIVTLVRDDLAEAIIERMDIDFINPAKTAGTGVSLSPASITNGATAIPSSGNDAEAVRADIAALWAQADSTNMPATSAVYITDSRTARHLSMLFNPLGNREFPNISVTGGSIDGVPVLVSNYVPSDSDGSLFILAFASEIYLADDGVVTIDTSREASIFMDDAAQTATPTIAQIQSMFQTNQMAIRAERYVNWARRRPQAVSYLTGVNWGPDSV